MIGCLRAHVRKQPIIALYFESENELKFYNLKASSQENCCWHAKKSGFFHVEAQIEHWHTA